MGRTIPRQHRETHFTGSEAVRDVVIGMSDGLTVPVALAAGISGAVAATGLVVTAGMAEIAAGSIAMGLGGYLAARSEAEHLRIGGSYIVGDLIPLAPYFFFKQGVFGADPFGRGHPPGAHRFRLREGKPHRRLAVQERLPDRRHRRHRSDRRLLPRPPFLTRLTR